MSSSAGFFRIQKICQKKSRRHRHPGKFPDGDGFPMRIQFTAYKVTHCKVCFFK